MGLTRVSALTPFLTSHSESTPSLDDARIALLKFLVANHRSKQKEGHIPSTTQELSGLLRRLIARSNEQHGRYLPSSMIHYHTSVRVP